MKTVMIVLVSVSSFLSVLSVAASADGFRCQGQGLSATLYDHVMPNEGTKNAAVLIVSSQEQGTIVVVQEPQKQNNEDTFMVWGENNAHTDGHFTGALLEIEKTPDADGSYNATLKLNSNGSNDSVPMICARYLKSAQ